MNERESLLSEILERQVNQSFQYNMVNATMVLKLHVEMKPISVLKIWERFSGEDSKKTETAPLWKKKKKHLLSSGQ